MRIVHEINDDKYLIKSAKNAYVENDDDQILHEVVKQKADNILTLLGDPEQLKVARKEAQELRARVCGEEFKGNSSSAGGKYSGFDSGTYTKNKDSNDYNKKKQDSAKETRYAPGGFSKYDDTGESDLYKKLGIKAPESKSEAHKNTPTKSKDQTPEPASNFFWVWLNKSIGEEQKKETKPVKKGLPPPPDSKCNFSVA